MTNDEFDVLKHMDIQRSRISPKEYILENLKNKEDRTLLYGYTCNRYTFHVYLKNGDIIKTIYKEGLDSNTCPVISFNDFIPDKRVYPSASDFEFCVLLQNLRVDIPFSSVDDRDVRQYYGEIINQ